MTRSLAFSVAAAVVMLSSAAIGQQPKVSNVNPDAGLLTEFRQKVDAYVKVRDSASSKAPDLRTTTKPSEIAGAEQTMALKIREARATAKRGDLFTPATEAMFRRLLSAPLAKGPDATNNKAIIKEDAPAATQVPFKVNAEYPKETPLSTVPPDVLLALPQLPEDIQYRFAGSHLLLYDAKANIIIDFMANAMP